MSDYPADARPVQPAVTQSPPAAAEHLTSAGVALIVGAGLGVAATIGAGALLIGVAVTQAIVIAAWVFGTGLPGRIGALAIGGLAAAAADLVVVHWPHGQLSPLLAVVGLALPVMFVHQLTRGVVRARVTESLSDIALLVVCVVALAAFIQLRHETGGAAMASATVFAASGALVVGHLVDARWPVARFDPTVARGLTGVVAATAVAAVIGYVRLHGTVEFSAGRSAFLGAAVGAVVSLLAVGIAFVRPSPSAPAGALRHLRPVYAVVIPLALVAPIGYLLCLAVRG